MLLKKKNKQKNNYILYKLTTQHVLVSALLLEVAAQLAPRSAKQDGGCSAAPAQREAVSKRASSHCLILVENPTKRVSLTKGMRRL